jgi:DNA-binding GntR family transcriptional regulator
MAINRDGADYLYVQLADDIRRRCRSREWAPDHRIPPITELMAEYQLSDRTVRQAIGLLVDEGLLVTKPGRGTYVCP